MVCVTIEPLKEEWMQQIRTVCQVELTHIPRGDEAAHAELLGRAEVLICRDRDLSEEYLQLYPALQLLYIVSAGVEKLPFACLKKRGILVANTGGVSDRAMSDYAMGVMLLFSAHLKECVENKQAVYWRPFLTTEPLYEKRLLVVGAGRIGTAVAKKAHAFGMRVTGVRSSGAPKEPFDRMKSLEDLKEAVAEADYIVCTIPLTDRTRHLFDEELFACMNPEAVFINIARGGIVDEQALITALQQKRIRAAALDVFEKEPLSKDSPLWKLDNVVISPHSSGRIPGFMEHAVQVLIANLRQYAAGEAMENQVDLEKGY